MPHSQESPAARAGRPLDSDLSSPSVELVSSSQRFTLAGYQRSVARDRPRIGRGSAQPVLVLYLGPDGPSNDF